MRTTIILNNQKGAVAVLFAIMLVIIFAFAAGAVDVGAWFVARAELSKSLDAAALAAAKNISNPFVDPLLLAKQFARENFRDESSWTVGTPTINASWEEQNRVRVSGSVNTESYFARIFDIDTVVATSGAVARKNAVEIMLVLDRSGSMDGSPMRDLKAAARSFVSFFEDTQEQDQVGLISFATSVTIDVPRQNNFVSAMQSAINDMDAVGATNAEDALDQSDGPYGLTDQSGFSGDEYLQQYVIFFSDGNPTAFRGTFRYNGEDNIDAVVCGTGNTCDTVYQRLGDPDSETWLRMSGNYIDPRLTGDGNTFATSSCNDYPPLLTTRWYVFEDYPVEGHGPLECYIPRVNLERGGRRPNYTYSIRSVTAPLSTYVCDTARQMALDHAEELKDGYIKIYTIGLGNVDRDFLGQLASGDDFAYYAPSSGELLSIFNHIAKEIKLRLVE